MSSISGNSISLEAATRQTMAAIMQQIAAISAIMINILKMVNPPSDELEKMQGKFEKREYMQYEHVHKDGSPIVV